MSPERPENEQGPEFPYTCPACETDLGLRGALVVWFNYPNRAVGHIELGVGGDEKGKEAIQVSLDKIGYNPEPILECANCGTELTNYFVEEIFLDPECNIEKDDEAE